MITSGIGTVRIGVAGLIKSEFVACLILCGTSKIKDVLDVFHSIKEAVEYMIHTSYHPRSIIGILFGGSFEIIKIRFPVHIVTGIALKLPDMSKNFHG